jgi:hypothetical protein
MCSDIDVHSNNHLPGLLIIRLKMTMVTRSGGGPTVAPVAGPSVNYERWNGGCCKPLTGTLAHPSIAVPPINRFFLNFAHSLLSDLIFAFLFTHAGTNGRLAEICCLHCITILSRVGCCCTPLYSHSLCHPCIGFLITSLHYALS